MEKGEGIETSWLFELGVEREELSYFIFTSSMGIALGVMNASCSWSKLLLLIFTGVAITTGLSIKMLSLMSLDCLMAITSVCSLLSINTSILISRASDFKITMGGLEIDGEGEDVTVEVLVIDLDELIDLIKLLLEVFFLFAPPLTFFFLVTTKSSSES